MISVENWAEIGPLREVMDYECGELSTVAPEESYVVQLIDDRGDIFLHERPFGTFDGAELLATRVRKYLSAGGLINLDHWVYYRTVYGSDAWVEDGHEHAQIERERAA